MIITYVNDPSNTIVLNAFPEQRRELLGEGKDPLNVQDHELCPSRIGVRLVRLAPNGARVVDEDV